MRYSLNFKYFIFFLLLFQVPVVFAEQTSPQEYSIQAEIAEGEVNDTIFLDDVIREYKYLLMGLAVIFIWVLILNQRLRGSQIKLLHEITYRLKSEKALLENEDSFRALFENIFSGVVVYEARKNGEEYYIKDINAEGMRISGVKSKADILDKNIIEVFPGVKDMGLYDVFRRVYLTGVSEYLPTASYKDQEIEAWYENHVYKLPSGRLVAVYTDVSEEKKADGLLRKSEERYRVITEQTGQLVYDYDVQSGKIHWAGAIEQITGCSSTEFQSVDIQAWEKMIHPEDRKHAVFLLKEARARTGYYHVDYRFQRKDQTYCFIDDSGIFIDDERPNSLRMLGTMQDITKRKEIEDTLKTQKDILSNVLTRIPHYIFWKDRDLVYMGCNTKFAQMVNLESPECIIGKRDEDLNWGTEKREAILKTEKEIIDKGEPLINVEEQMVVNGGEEATTLSSKVPLRNTNEEVIGLLGIFTDITDRKHSEKFLHENLEELKKYYEATIDREERMIELKKEVNDLSARLKLPRPYDLSFIEGEGFDKGE
ncbi:MAG: PAS domain-containing protein [Candidatus Omnitrophica bacterium]|nr:PAS domain-containing protein [Candidatus Omnitrophota bacterium]